VENPSITITAITLTAVVAALLVGLAGMVARSRRQERVNRTVRDTIAGLAAANDVESVEATVSWAVNSLAPASARYQIRLAAAEQHGAQEPAGATAAAAQHGGLVPVGAMEARDGGLAGALLVDERTAADSRLRPALEVISIEAALAVQRLRLADTVRHTDEHGLAGLFEQTDDLVLIVDTNLLIRYASPSVRLLLGPQMSEHRPFLDLIEDPERRAAESFLRHALTGRVSPEDVSHADWTINAAGDKDLLVEATCRPLVAGDSVSGVVVTLRDVTTQRRLEHELTRRTFHDLLTGLPNRQLFSELVSHDLATGTGHTGVLLVDLDNFKAINDTLGHDIGDAVLAEVGHRLSDVVGYEGVAARIGDDEFAALIRDVSSQAPDEAAARFAGALSDPIAVGAREVSCTASIGVATSDTAGTAQDLLKHADLALGTAKAAGHGQWRRYDPVMAAAATDRAALRNALSFAAHNDSLTVEYQPIVALATGRTVGFEALVRWQHPAGGSLGPEEFIGIAEESGLIVPIGEWVLATALTAARRWQDSGHDGPPYLSVNVSAQQFRSAGFLQSVQRLLAASGLPPDRLVLEITESLLLHDEDKAWDDLRRLRHLGIRIAIDDFGTGYSALGYLRHAPLDLLKLDRLFIGPLTSSARQRELVKGVVSLARGLELDVVAEGIENRRQRDICAAIGCGYGQGYFFARPTPDPAAFLLAS
jgi:diguanylate cyclase (GGDEF)-like protein